MGRYDALGRGLDGVKDVRHKVKDRGVGRDIDGTMGTKKGRSGMDIGRFLTRGRTGERKGL